MKIQTDRIIPNPEQPRREFSQVELKGLATSIRKNGLIHSIVVEEPAGDGPYILIDGERRWRAVKMLGWKEIDATVRPASNGAGAQERSILALVANIQRQDLTKIEEAHAFAKLREMGLSHVAIANRLGISTQRVANRLALLDLEEEIQELMASDLLPSDPRVVIALKSLPDEVRATFARKLARPGLTIKSALTSVEKMRAALAAKRVYHEPALQFAAQKAGAVNLPNWGILQQVGKVPPWDEVTAAARHTCQTCVLRSEASEAICRDCPAVAMLARLIKTVAPEVFGKNEH